MLFKSGNPKEESCTWHNTKKHRHHTTTRQEQEEVKVEVEDRYASRSLPQVCFDIIGFGIMAFIAIALQRCAALSSNHLK